MVFLLALGSGKRRSEIHAWLNKNIRQQADWSKMSLYPSQSFLASPKISLLLRSRLGLSRQVSFVMSCQIRRLYLCTRLKHMMLEPLRLPKLFKLAFLWTKSWQHATGSPTTPLPNSILKMLLGRTLNFFI